MDLFDGTFRQPDQRSCGAAVLVMERMLRDPAYAATVLDGRHASTRHVVQGDGSGDRFSREVLAMHRRVTGPVSLHGRLQLPWPRALGTPPWSVAGQLAGSRGIAHRTVPARFAGQRATALALLRNATAAGWTVPLYVGSALLPRHVVLVLDPDLAAYDPSRGRRTRIDATGLTGGRIAVAGWTAPWAVVLPAAVST